MQLFDSLRVDPTKVGYRDRNEPAFNFLETSGRENAAIVRDMLEKWFQDYPKEHQYELRRRFASSSTDFQSAVFELALHATFRQFGAKLVIHPKVSQCADKRPDFLVQLSSGFEFYLEATTVFGQSDEDRNREQILSSLYSIIDRRLDSPEYFWSVTIVRQGPTAPSGKQIVHELAQHMTGLDREKVLTAFATDDDHSFKFVWENAGWCIEFLPIPKRQEAIGKADHRPIGATMTAEATWCNDDIDVREAIRIKLKHHINLDKPYVIAVNAIKDGVGSRDIFHGVYGSDNEAVIMSGTGGFTTQQKLALDGVWTSPQGPKNHRLIAVVGVAQLGVWTVASSKLVIYENPYIDFPSELRLADMSRWERREDRLYLVKGRTLGSHLSLPESGSWSDQDDEWQ